jgi:hypothetical protein
MHLDYTCSASVMFTTWQRDTDFGTQDRDLQRLDPPARDALVSQQSRASRRAHRYATPAPASRRAHDGSGGNSECGVPTPRPDSRLGFDDAAVIGQRPPAVLFVVDGCLRRRKALDVPTSLDHRDEMLEKRYIDMASAGPRHAPRRTSTARRQSRPPCS